MHVFLYKRLPRPLGEPGIFLFSLASSALDHSATAPSLTCACLTFTSHAVEELVAHAVAGGFVTDAVAAARLLDPRARTGFDFQKSKSF